MDRAKSSATVQRQKINKKRARRQEEKTPNNKCKKKKGREGNDVRNGFRDSDGSVEKR
jgi:hypothetical protein